MSFSQYKDFLKENTVITNTDEAEMILRVGENIAKAAQKLLEANGRPDYLKDFEWEFKLVKDDSINAWAMPGGKIVFYSGILDYAMDENGIAVIMGHEVAHTILNHGQQRMSAEILKQAGAIGLFLVTGSSEMQSLIMFAYGLGSDIFGTLPYSRQHEIEADQYGLILMALAGYEPDEAVTFWERMSSSGGSDVPEFLSTHPSYENRIGNLKLFSHEAKMEAIKLGGSF